MKREKNSIEGNDALDAEKREVMTFGKYKGLTKQEVLLKNAGYICWAANHVEHFACSESLLAEAEELLSYQSNEAMEEGEQDILITHGVTYNNVMWGD